MFDFNRRVTSSPSKREKGAVAALLAGENLLYEEGADRVAIAEDPGGNVAATASLFGNVIRMVAVSPDWREAGLSAAVISDLMREARESGLSHLFIYTKPDAAERFASLGFRVIASTGAASLLEIGEPGVGAYGRYLEEAAGAADGTAGAVVMNCNPFTRGHRYLIEQASRECDRLYVIIVESDLSFFTFKDRYAMVERGVSDLENVKVLRSGQYAVSAATFPTYFLKDRETLAVASVQAELDVDLFLRLFVPRLRLGVRFVGSEPNCAVTNAYNQAMLARLPREGVQVRVLERCATRTGEAISASAVREKLASGETADLARYLPDTTMQYLRDELSYPI